MIFSRILAAVIVASGSLSVAQAELIDRGNGLIYDDVLNITWTQDASLGVTSGLHTWDRAVEWVDGLMFQGFDDWRLPSMSAVTTVALDLSTHCRCGPTQ